MGELEGNMHVGNIGPFLASHVMFTKAAINQKFISFLDVFCVEWRLVEQKSVRSLVCPVNDVISNESS
jgi:hypothetical protein